MRRAAVQTAPVHPARIRLDQGQVPCRRQWAYDQGMVPTLRVLIADADGATRNALALLFRSLLGLDNIGEATDGETLSQSMAKDPPGLLLLDWSLPGRPTLEALREFQSSRPQLRLVILSVDGAMAEKARALGAVFISKGSAAEAVLEQLRGILEPSAGGSLRSDVC